MWFLVCIPVNCSLGFPEPTEKLIDMLLVFHEKYISALDWGSRIHSLCLFNDCLILLTKVLSPICFLKCFFLLNRICTYYLVLFKGQHRSIYSLFLLVFAVQLLIETLLSLDLNIYIILFIVFSHLTINHTRSKLHCWEKHTHTPMSHIQTNLYFMRLAISYEFIRYDSYEHLKYLEKSKVHC